MARPTVPATGQHWRHKSTIPGLAEEEISFTGLRERCDVMANRSDREHGQPTACPRRQSLISRMGPCSRTPSGPAVPTDCVNRRRTEDRTRPKPTRQFAPCNAGAIHRGHAHAVAFGSSVVVRIRFARYHDQSQRSRLPSRPLGFQMIRREPRHSVEWAGSDEQRVRSRFSCSTG